MRIAVIGGGIAGMMSWYLLRQQHQVTLFEAGNYLGGHTATVDVSVNGRQYAVDTGFIVFNNWTYPLFNRFIAELGVPFQHTTMSFAVTDRAADFEYNGNNLWSLFAQKRNLLRPSFWRMLRDIVRFNKIAKQAVADNSADLDLPVDAFLQKHQLGHDMRDKYLLPMGAAIWSAGLTAMPDFPLRFFLQFCNNHGLLNINDRPQWAVIKGGSREYVKAMLAKCGSDGIRLNSPVAKVRRFDESVEIALADGSTEHFDQVVFACHSDQALKMLADATPAEQQVLGGIAYQDNDVVLHTDIRLLPKRKAAWAAWNYLLGADAATRATLSYNMNMLQGINSDSTFVVSLNASDRIAPEQVLRRFTYAHPVYNNSTMRSQARRGEINGQNRSYYCGAYWYNGFHEDGVRSAVDVAAMLGVQFLMSAHAIYRGQVGHQRLKPKPHGLHYDIQYFWLDLGALAELPPQIQRESFGAFSLRRRDYFQGCAAVAGIADLAEAARVRAAALGADISDIDQVFLLSPLANWGVYFSPLTQYYLYRQGQPRYLLAEVSNTPWNERHHYLVPLGADGVTEFSHAKNFHVSPFNPLDMQYHWRIAAPATQFNLLLQNSRLGEKVFSAWFRLQREALDAHSIRRMLIRQPWQNVQVVIRIYWQALLLLVKGLPFYSHQKPKDQSV